MLQSFIAPSLPHTSSRISNPKSQDKCACIQVFADHINIMWQVSPLSTESLRHDEILYIVTHDPSKLWDGHNYFTI